MLFLVRIKSLQSLVSFICSGAKDKIFIKSILSVPLFPSLIAWALGDPHINTLDDRMYTFNGLGEYTLIQIGDQFELQGRTEPVNMNTTATQFSACAMASPINGAKIQVSNMIICSIKLLMIHINL